MRKQLSETAQLLKKLILVRLAIELKNLAKELLKYLKKRLIKLLKEIVKKLEGGKNYGR